LRRRNEDGRRPERSNSKKMGLTDTHQMEWA
jgi:hypothetical protein